MAAKVMSFGRVRRGTQLVDSPVSGGPRGAQAGTVTAMLGGDDF